jgi:hypothetical protein
MQHERNASVVGVIAKVNISENNHSCGVLRHVQHKVDPMDPPFGIVCKQSSCCGAHSVLESTHIWHMHLSLPSRTTTELFFCFNFTFLFKIVKVILVVLNYLQVTHHLQGFEEPFAARK